MALAVIVAGTATGCGLRTAVPQSLSPPTSAASVPAANGSRVGPGSISTGMPSSPADTVGGANPAPTVAPATDAPAAPSGVAAAQAEVLAVYHDFLQALSGLDGDFQARWVTSLQAAATAPMVASAVESAHTIELAHEHTVGTLTDTVPTVRISGGTAILSDCLDESDWHVVEDSSGVPDPAITRGHFTGTAELTRIGGRWYVAQFAPGTSRC